MMSRVRVALLADVHANLEALTACLAHAREQGADAHAFLGDLVGYGPDPGPVLDVVAEHVARGAVAVRGNHDEAVVEARGDLSSSAAKAVLWTRDRLSPAHHAFLAALPLAVRRDDVLFVHASADAPAAWTYVTDPVRAGRSLSAAEGARYVFCGHVHEPALYYAGPAQKPRGFHPVPGVAIPLTLRYRWLAIAGSAGQPRDGNTAACWALFDAERATLTYHRVPYDWATAAAKVRAAGLPEWLAHRLERGQ
jgi:diadenosine tetraphosphatase ApaH/serine/threonine PP2A family protein phosphatase